METLYTEVTSNMTGAVILDTKPTIAAPTSMSNFDAVICSAQSSGEHDFCAPDSSRQLNKIVVINNKPDLRDRYTETTRLATQRNLL
jgi:hypothetical protein